MNEVTGYYEIDLERGSGAHKMRAVVGVGLRGQIVSYRQDGQSIGQYNGLDAEAFVEQMATFDPPWRVVGRTAR